MRLPTAKLINAALLRRFLWPLVIAISMAGCDQQPTAIDPAQHCEADTTPISQVQGSGAQSELTGQRVTVSGIVTLTQTEGFFVQSAPADSDGDAATSEALWIANTEPPDPPGQGERVAVAGQVTELPTGSAQHTLTALLDSYWTVCGQASQLPLQMVARLDNLEAFENMRLQLPDGWQVADLYPLRNQQLRIASEKLYIPTQIVAPGQSARRLQARNRQRSVTLDWSGSGFSLHSRLRAGDQLRSITGVMDLRPQRPVLLAEQAPAISRAAKVPPVPPLAEGLIRVVSMNVENLFNGNGRGGGFPAPRGAQTRSQYQQQLARLVAAVTVLDPAVLALMELENDGYSADSAIAQLSAELQQASGQPWTFIKPAEERLGDDEIAVGLLYRTDRVMPLGASATLTARPFDGLSRVPLAQRFKAINSKASLIIAVNHFKSKGGCPRGNARNSDQDDGQGCWNEARIRSATVLSDWLKQLQQDWREPRVLIAGDLNSYRMEQPIRALLRAGWLDVAGEFLEPPLYSYRYFGEIGTLDYIFASAAQMPSVQAAHIWHINSDAAPGEQIAASSTGIARFSDHDPVIVDIKL